MGKRAVSTTIVAVIVIAILIVAVFAVYLATRPPAAPAAKVGLILATGGLGDKSFNDISYAGVVRARDELGINFSYVEPTMISQYEGFQRDFAKTGEYAIIVCIGFDQADALYTVASEYPNQKFAIVDMSVNNTNVASLLFKANEASFLVGVVAGMKTSTGKVGFVGGMDIPLIRDFFVGYEAGVKWANSTVTIVTPVFVGGWADPTKGKELALGLVDAGVDAIYVAAGKSGLGALEAAHERGVTGLGVDACQCYLYPEIVASATKRVDVAVFETIKAALDGTFEGGVHTGGLKEKWVGCCRLPDEEAFWEAKFSFTHQALATTIIDKISEANDKIVSGEIVVPSAF
jgi:basic membrane protein A